MEAAPRTSSDAADFCNRLRAEYILVFSVSVKQIDAFQGLSWSGKQIRNARSQAGKIRTLPLALQTAFFAIRRRPTTDGCILLAAAWLKSAWASPQAEIPLPGSTASCAVEDAMNAAGAKTKEQLCQGVSRVDEPCDLPAKQYCERCGQWFCRAHFPDPDWHSCAPDQGTG